MEQLQLAFVPEPGHCDHEVSTASMNDNGTSVKSLCNVSGAEIWTNCRSWGRCTFLGDVFGREVAL